MRRVAIIISGCFTLIFSPLWLLAQSEPAPTPDTGGVPEANPGPAAAAPDPAVPPEPAPVPLRSVVYEVQDRDAIQDYKAFGRPVRRMVDELVTILTGAYSPGQAWASLVKPNDVVGLKVSANGAPLFSTRPEVVQAIVAGLEEAGVPPHNIIVWDRDPDLLAEAGFFNRAGGYRVEWSEMNYDPQAMLTSAVVGRLIFGDLLFVGRRAPNFKAEVEADPRARQPHRSPDNLSNQSFISKVLTRDVTKVINLPVLSDHIFCGLAGAMYNMTVQNVDNWRRLADEQERGNPAIPEMYADPRISGKVVLTVMDGLVALYAGGPTGDPNYAVHFGTLYASKDPVAIDAIALKQLDHWRLEAKLDPASKDAKYVETASEYQLGNSDLGKIELRQLPLQLRTDER